MEHLRATLNTPKVDYGALVRNKVSLHYKTKNYAPSYLLIGRGRLLEFAEFIFDSFSENKKDEYRSFQEFYWELKNTISTYYGLTVIVVDNDRGMLRVV